MAVNQGALEVYGEPGTGRLLSAVMVGPGAEHIAHLLAWSVVRGDTVQQMLSYPCYHPTLEGGLRTAFRDLQQTLRPGPSPTPIRWTVVRAAEVARRHLPQGTTMIQAGKQECHPTA